MAKKEVNIKFKADPKEAQTGINKVTAELNKLNKQTKSSDIAKFAKSFSQLGVTFAAVTKTLKVCLNTIKETSQALNVQIKAEKQLEVAAKNNPYLSTQSVENLKKYASELQSISTVGDEVLIPMMAELASSGRSEAEIMQIMGAALDVSASGMMSLDAAVSALNKTYSGSVGLLGNQISGLKELTAEELKNGEAVKLVSERFKGMAEETSKVTGSYEKMKNAQGDFNEAVGKWTKASFDLFNENMQKSFERSSRLLNKLMAELDLKEELKILKKSVKNETLFDEVSILPDDKLNQLKEYYLSIDWKKRTANERKILEVISDEVAKREDEQRIQAAQVRQAEKRAEAERKAAEEQEKRNKLAEDAYNNFKNTISQAEQEIAKRRELGEVISEEDELQQMLNVKTNAYIKLLEEAQGTITGESEREKQFIDEVNEGYKKLYQMQDARKASKTKKDTNSLLGNNDMYEKGLDFLDLPEDKISDQIQETIDALKAEQAMLKISDASYAKYVTQIIKLERLKEEVILKENEIAKQENLETIATMTEQLNSYFSEFASIVTGMTNLLSQELETQVSNQNKALKEQYENGLISYDDFNKRKQELDREAAKKMYTIQMWEWAANILQATANTAVAVTRALSSLPPPASYVMAGLTAASGAVQLATILANKPKAPAFEKGGIVPGTSYIGDNVQANVNSKEMILTQAQQKQLWEMANGKGGASGSVVTMPVNIQNNSNASVSAELTLEGLQVIIDSQVQNSLQSGRYSQSLNIANGRMQGVRIL